MAHKKFTKADDLSGGDVPQSVGPHTTGDVHLSPVLEVFQPHQGRDLIYKNPKFNSGSTEITQSNDNRIPLGTYTLNNRDFWENNNFNESTFQPYLNEEYDYRESYKLKTWGSTQVNTPDGDIVLPTMPPGDVLGEGSGDYYESNTGKFSVEALPFVINPNNQDIIHLDRYYDKEIDKENYELATEGKINLKLEVKRYGRVHPLNPLAGAGTYNATQEAYFNNFGMNIDIFSNRNSVGAYIDNSIRRPGVTSISGSNDGCHLFKLNWNDGTELEHTSEPKLLEDSVLFEHFYEKPGFYSITGVIYRVKDGKLKTWEKFQTNILLNPSPNYELNLLDYNDFASIGGISKDSTLVKSLYNIVGINPLPPYGSANASEEVIEKLNEFDKIQLLNVLGKVDYERIQPYWNFLSPYQTPTDDIASFVFGCADSTSGNLNRDAEDNLITDINGDLPDDNGYMALNYDPNATIDDGTCIYTYNVTLDVYPSSVVLDAEEYDLDLATPIEPYVNLTLWDSAGDGWFGQTGNINNARLTINDVNYMLGNNIYEKTFQVQLDPGVYAWVYQVPWYKYQGQIIYAPYQDYENSWQVALPDGTILLEGNGENYGPGIVAGTFDVPDQETVVDEYSFIMPTPRIDDLSITNPSIINAHQDIGISLNYSDSIAPFETSGNPNEIDYAFRGWFDGSLVNQSNDDYSIDGIEPVFQNETITDFNVGENIHLIAIYEYDDTRPPLPVSSVELISGNGIDFPLESINVRYLPPNPLPVPMDIVSFEIVRSYSTWSNGNITRHSEFIHTQDFIGSYGLDIFYNHLDDNLDTSILEYTYSVFTVDDVGNRSIEVSSTETPIADIPPATPVVEGLVNQESADGYKYVEFTWTVLDPTDPTSNIQGIVDDNTTPPSVGDFSHYVVKRTQIGGTEEGAVYYPMNTYNNLNEFGEGFGSGTRPDEYIGNYLFRDNTVDYTGPSYIYQVASVDINNHESPYSPEMEILPSLSADIGMINSATWMDGVPSVRPPGISLNWSRVYYREISADSLELDESSVTFSAEFNPYPGEHQAGGNYIGFEIQKKANGEWSRNGVSILADTWQTIGPFYKTTDITGESDGLGAAGTVGAEWEVPHLEQYELYGVTDLLFVFPELGPYPYQYPNLYPAYPDRASNTMSSFSSEFNGHTTNESVQYADIPEESDEITNTFYDDGWESKWGTLVPGLEYQYRIRNITTDKDSFSPPNLPIYFGNWAESEPVMVGESTPEPILGCTDDRFWNYNDLADTEYNPSTCLNSSISDYTFNLNGAPGGFIELTWDKPVDVNLFMPSGWNIDWNTVQYEIQYKQVGSNSWSTLATVDYDTDTYEFNSDSTGYVVDTNYQFRIRIQTPNPLPAFSTDVVSNWNYVDSDTYIGGLVNIYMSQTALTVTPTMLSTTTLSSDIDETYPNSLTITAQTETGLDFLGWTIQSPHTADWGDFISIEDTSALSTTVSWVNDDDSLNHVATTISIFADYETVQGGGGGGPVGVVIYAGNYGSVSTDGFELTSTNQNQSINAYPQADNDDFTYSFVKWEVQSGVNNVGFEPNYSSETPVKNTNLKWNNAGNPNDVNASVKAFFSRQTKGGGTGGGTSCFLKGTMITMADKTTKPIEQIQVGNLVMSYDEDTNLITHNKVIDRYYHQFDETNAYLIINNNIRVTENHVMYVPNNRWTEEPGDKWLRADHIIVGDYLYDTELNKVEVKSIEKINESVVTYNFEVENTHTYFAENVLVHNIGGDGPGGGSGKIKKDKGATSTAQYDVGLNG